VKRMVINASLLTGVVVLALARHAWVVLPGLGLLAASQWVLPVALWRALEWDRYAGRVLWLRLASGYVGGAYLLSLFAGRPSTTRFWLVFAFALAVALPIVVLAGRLLLGGRRS
jgi:hypothetical protein